MRRRLGRLLDAEDRALLARAGVLVAGAVTLALTAAATLGLAWRVFWYAAGG